MKICLKENEFNPSFIALYGEEKAKANGYTIVEVDDKYSDCNFEDFDNFVFSVEKYNARKNAETNILTINELTQKLESTDYIANKLAEAVSKYISTGDNTDVLLLREKYALELANREAWRKEIDKLQQELKMLDK